MAGFAKTFTPMEQLAQRMKWTATLPPAAVRGIGIAELAGAVGLLLPALTRILLWLTPVAAVGLALIMVLAIAFHSMRKEYQSAGMNVILLVMALFVVWGRFALAPL
jgi:uncharacterized membrane protein YphA (DoxX/SURF4 family)